eukprot:CAMPEP_0194271594 /NCGR_PEP_ID=MMETSP0169-20130528/5336_1 /TAXON_ID=218684 /ORGANISM="Corethron pennatum, Strain L29A3" /LENGTH=1088 /DNA_ID=CAMNT_0039013977 /DNA_START=145 /DNA_END=3411 /DNA_ORIENTATION=-
MASFKPGATNAKGRCMNWVKGKSYTYPDDFKDASDVAILNVVDIYKCPTSKKRIIISNGVPDHTVKQGNGNIPCEIRWAITLPLVHEKPEGEIQEIPIRGIIAMSTNGVPAYGPQEVGSDNAVDPTGQIQDAQFWYGHATMQKVWHFHNPYMGKEAPDKDTLLGYALDGYPIYGPYPENSSVALDECNGIFINGQYQYHVLEIDAIDGTTTDYCKSGEPKEVNNWNYILGCYKGKTSETIVQPSDAFDIPTDCECESWSENGECKNQPTSSPTKTGPATDSPVASPNKGPGTSSPTKSGPVRRPNIIVMQPDDMSFFDVWTPPPNSPGKRKPTPLPDDGMTHLENLRTGGIQFMQAYTASPVCGTSRFSTITGKYPSRSISGRGDTSEEKKNVNIPSTKLEETDCTTNNLAVTFQNNGYRTGMVGKWHLSVLNDYTYTSAQTEVKKCGFDFVDGLYASNLGDLKDGEGGNNDDIFSHNMEWVTSEAIKFIDDDQKDEVGNDIPFFIYFNPTVPHGHHPVRDSFYPQQNTKYNCRGTPREVLTADPVVKTMTENGCAAYREGVASRAENDDDLGNIWIDDAVGALIQTLKDKDIFDNTVFLFQQDHGMIVKGSLFDSSSRIPMFFHYPDLFPEGFTFDKAVSVLDIGPTLFEITGIEPSYKLDGISWLSAVSTSPTPAWWNERCIFAELDQDRSVRCGCYKYLLIDNQDSDTYTKGKKQGYSVEGENLFDLCDGGTEYVTDRLNNMEADGKDVSSANPSETETYKKLLQCHIDKTSPQDPTGYDTCELSSTNSPVASPNKSPATDSPVASPNKGSTPAPTSNPNPQPTPVENYTFLGCYKDKANDRALPHKKGGTGTTDDECATLCIDYKYFALESRRHCYCGNGDYARHGSDSGCECSKKLIGRLKLCVYENNSLTEAPNPIPGTESPTMAPTKKLTRSPTSDPTESPTMAPTSKPTRYTSDPTGTPKTGSPTVSTTTSCTDSLFYFSSKAKNCKKLVKNKTEKQAKMLCDKWDKFGRQVKNHCPKTCELDCAERCANDADYIVTRTKGKKEVTYNCEEIPNQDVLCNTIVEKQLVGEYCRASCGMCG